MLQKKLGRVLTPPKTWTSTEADSMHPLLTPVTWTTDRSTDPKPSVCCCRDARSSQTLTLALLQVVKTEGHKTTEITPICSQASQTWRV